MGYLNRVGRDAGSRDRQLAASFNNMKDACVDVLLQLDHATEAFQLASTFGHFRGLLEACEGDASLCPSLYALVAERGSNIDPTDGETPLSLFALYYFERQRKLSTILEYADIVGKALLQVFFSTRPQLAWAYSLRRNSGNVGRDLLDASQAALLYSQSQSGVTEASTLLSISKLSAVAAMASVGGENVAADREIAETLYKSSTSNLAVIRAMQVAEEEGIIR